MRRLLQVILALLIFVESNSQSFPAPAYAEIDNNYRNYVNRLAWNHIHTSLLFRFYYITQPSHR